MAGQWHTDQWAAIDKANVRQSEEKEHMELGGLLALS